MTESQNHGTPEHITPDPKRRNNGTTENQSLQIPKMERRKVTPNPKRSNSNTFHLHVKQNGFMKHRSPPPPPHPPRNLASFTTVFWDVTILGERCVTSHPILCRFVLAQTTGRAAPRLSGSDTFVVRSRSMRIV